MARGLDAWGRHLSRRYDPRRTIVVAGSPRGGTSWVAETIATTPGALILWEPLEPSTHPNILQVLGIGFDHYIPPGTRVTPDMPDWTLYQYLQRVFAGQVPLSEYLGIRGWRKAPIRNLLRFRRYVVKFVRGNMLLHWMLREFDLKGVLILRHPCAVVASQMHFAWENAVRKRERWLPFFERHDPSLVPVVRSIRTDEEKLALDWAVTNLWPLRQPRPHPWFLTTYEDLIEGTAEWERLCRYLDCPVPARDLITRPSSTSKRR